MLPVIKDFEGLGERYGARIADNPRAAAPGSDIAGLASRHEMNAAGIDNQAVELTQRPDVSIDELRAEMARMNGTVSALVRRVLEKG